MNASSRRASLAVFSLLTLVVGLAFDTLLTRHTLPLFRDLLFFVVPFKHFLGQQLQEGNLPLWNPWILMGTPFLASLQTGVLYPPSLFLILPFPLGFNLFVFSHYLVALTGAYVLLRDRRLSLPSAAIGSLCFVLGGYLVSMLNLTNHLQSAVWAPWVFCCWTRHRRSGSLLAVAAFVCVVSLQLLGGSPESLTMTLLLVAAWTVYDSMPDGSAAAKSALFLSGALGLAGAVTAFQSLPTFELIQQSARGHALSFKEVSAWSLQPVSLLQLLFPHSTSLVTPEEKNTLGQLLEDGMPWIHSIYLGLVPLCLMIVGLTSGRERRFWGTLAAAAILMALGSHTPLFGALYQLAPGVLGKFRYPEKFFFLVHWASFVLAAEGAENILRGHRAAQRMACIVAALFLSIGAAIWWLGAARPFDLLWVMAYLKGKSFPLMAFVGLATDFVFKSQRLLLVLGTFVTVVLLARWSLIRTSLAGALFAALTAADLGLTHHDLNLRISWPQLTSRPLLVDPGELERAGRLRIFDYQTFSRARFGIDPKPVPGLEEELKFIHNLDDMPEFTVELWPTLPSNTGMIYGVRNVLGGEGIDRNSVNMLRDVLSMVPRNKTIGLLRLFGVGYLIGDEPLETPDLEAAPLASSSAYYVYRVRNPVPLAYAVTRLRPAENDLKAFNLLISSGFEPGQEAVVERLPGGWTERSPDGSPGEVTIESYETDRVVIRTKLKHRALVVLNDSYFPGWEVEVDGSAAEILRTNVLVRGVSVGAGDHTVEFEYRPAWFRVGSRISIAGLVVLLGLTVAGIRQRRRRKLVVGSLADGR